MIGSAGVRSPKVGPLVVVTVIKCNVREPMKHTYAVKRQGSGERLLAPGAGPGAGRLAAAFHSGSDLPQATGSRKWPGMADGAGGVSRHAMHGMADQARVQDLLARARQGRLRDGEVEVMQRPDVGPMQLRHLAQSLEATATAPGRPVADALQSGSASIGNGRVRMPGIGGAGDPAAIAHQLGVLRPQATRIISASSGRFEVQAKLNPWVSVATGRALPELEADPNMIGPQRQYNDGDQHPIELGVEWCSVLPQHLPAQPYDSDNMYSGFMQALAAADGLDMEAEKKQAMKVHLLSDFYHQLKSLSAAQLQEIGHLLEEDIDKHEASDTLDKAFDETRLVYRTWHAPSHISVSTGLGASQADGRELVGADNLKTVLDPEKFRHYKQQSKLPGSVMPSLGASPSSLLYPDPDQPNVVFLKERGTAAALLPENLNAGFNAYNEAAKFMLRGKTSEELAGEFSKLHYHAKKMRASVTRPLFFNSDDLQSNTDAFLHPDKPGDRPHVRKIHNGLHVEHNPLRQSFDLKLADPFRANAIFYQTFSEYSKPNTYAEEWNEMVVKYRQKGHMAGLFAEIRAWVPELKDYPGIVDELIDSGKFNADFAKAIAGKEEPAANAKSSASKTKPKKQTKHTKQKIKK